MNHIFTNNNMIDIGTVVKGADKVSTKFDSNTLFNVDTVLDATDRERMPLELLQEAAKDPEIREALKQLLSELATPEMPEAAKKKIGWNSSFFKMEHLANTVTVADALYKLVPDQIKELLNKLG